MLRGDAVVSFTMMFLQMWELDEKDPNHEGLLAVPAPLPQRPGGFVIPYGDCPLDDYKTGERVYLDILNRAERYVHIMTPYLILDGEMENALKYAAERGVEVSLILPGIPDKKMPYAIAKTYYNSLLAAGVKIYEYTPGFVHAKVFVADDCEAVVGTINLDYRSFYHHFECATYLYRVPCIREIEADFAATREKCRKVTDQTWKQEPFCRRLCGVLMKAIAPLL
jgi:cardiolipin synthase